MTKLSSQRRSENCSAAVMDGLFSNRCMIRNNIWFYKLIPPSVCWTLMKQWSGLRFWTWMCGSMEKRRSYLPDMRVLLRVSLACTLNDLCTCRTHPRLLTAPACLPYLPSVYNNVLFLFQLDEKCDKQYSDYSRVSAPLFLYYSSNISISTTNINIALSAPYILCIQGDITTQ